MHNTSNIAHTKEQFRAGVDLARAESQYNLNN